MDDLIAMAAARPLTVGDLEPHREATGRSLSECCDALARRVVELYLAGDLDWPVADAVMNNVVTIMTRHCGPSLPNHAWQVYLAFDAGESVAPGGDEVTKPLLAALRDRRDYA